MQMRCPTPPPIAAVSLPLLDWSLGQMRVDPSSIVTSSPPSEAEDDDGEGEGKEEKEGPIVLYEAAFGVGGVVIAICCGAICMLLVRRCRERQRRSREIRISAAAEAAVAGTFDDGDGEDELTLDEALEAVETAHRVGREPAAAAGGRGAKQAAKGAAKPGKSDGGRGGGSRVTGGERGGLLKGAPAEVDTASVSAPSRR